MLPCRKDGRNVLAAQMNRDSTIRVVVSSYFREKTLFIVQQVWLFGDQTNRDFGLEAAGAPGGDSMRLTST